MTDSNTRRFTGEVIDISSHIKALHRAAVADEGYAGNVRDFMADKNLSRLAVRFSGAVGFGVRTEVGAFLRPAEARTVEVGQEVRGEAVLFDAGCFVRKLG